MEYTLTKEAASLFESIKHIDENGIEFWYGRELAPYLGYTQWRSFESVIEKAKEACKTATGATENDFADVSKIVKAGAAEKPVQDFKLTRYACYLIAQNGDPRKKEIAEAQTYFAIQTRYAEIQQMQEQHPIDWRVPTHILYGENDNLTSLATISDFAHRTGASLEVMPGGEHWFHTPEQMAFLDGGLLGTCE